MKQKLSYALLLLAFGFLSCTQDSTPASTNEDSTQNEPQIESKIEENQNKEVKLKPVSEAFLITCKHIGPFAFICRNYDGILSKFDKKDVSEIEEDMMEGLFTKIKMGKDELKVFLDDNKNILSAVVTSSNYATKEGVRAQMKLIEVEEILGKTVTCHYIDEIGILTIELPGKEDCIIAKLDTKIKNKHISELLPSSLKKKEKILSNTPELKNFDLYLSEIIVLAK